ncbi:MAG: zinc-binding dehydrogenase [Ignavibacteriaceae bacterium]
MKQVFISDKKKVSLKEVPTPTAKKDWVLVKILTSPMCTEYKQYSSGVVNHPLGHEAAGEVVEVDQPGKLSVRDRVVVMPQYPCGKCALCISGEYIHCEHLHNFKGYTGFEYGDSTYAQYILKPSWLLPKIPDEITTDHASMLCCGLGPTFGAMDRMKADSSDTILISGLGPVGLGGVINAVYRNSKVIGVTKNEYRANLALELGADKIINPDDPDAVKQIKGLTSGKGIDASIDCAGDDSSQLLCVNSTKRKGHVAFVGESGRINLEVSDHLIRNGLTLHGVWHYNLNDIPKLFEVVNKSKDLIKNMITHTFSMEKVREAFELQITRKCGKVILKPFQ